MSVNKTWQIFPINILGTLLLPADAIRNLGVWFDSDFSSLAMSGISVRLVLFISGI